MASSATWPRRRLRLGAVALCALSLRVVAFAGPHLPRPCQLSLAGPITVLAGVLPAFPAAAAGDGGAGFQAIMFAPVISLFAIIGVAMIGGFVLGIFVPPGEGDYGDFETTLGEREARERGWRRGVLRGYDEETYAAMRGQSKEWAQARLLRRNKGTWSPDSSEQRQSAAGGCARGTRRSCSWGARRATRFVKMGSALATDTIPVLVTMVDVHNAKAQDMFYFCNVGSGGAATKVIGRSQTLSVEVGITTVLTLIVYECPEPVFTPETARCLGVLRVPVERLAERYSSGIFQQWFNLDTKTDPRMPAGDLQSLVTKFEQSYADSVNDIYQPKVCLSVIGSSFEVQQGSRSTFGIFVGEDVKTQAGPDLKALIASHKQQAAYIDALHEELRRLNTPSYRPLAASMAQPIGPGTPGSFAVPRQPGAAPGGPGGYGAFGAPVPSSMAPH
ncbi:unnamed protein product [Symbiodinium necroappetens]|uniref:Uncharacterized protein n=1 Tax=Symbiodinium necroappetens TaxID=1628268 RepID=A0A813AXW6_9DINO|nr:unnamed protein product [Symbiodinium necroappetens]